MLCSTRTASLAAPAMACSALILLLLLGLSSGATMCPPAPSGYVLVGVDKAVEQHTIKTVTGLMPAKLPFQLGKQCSRRPSCRGFQMQAGDLMLTRVDYSATASGVLKFDMSEDVVQSVGSCLYERQESTVEPLADTVVIIGTQTVTNVASGGPNFNGCFDMRGIPNAPGDIVKQWECLGAQRQMWYLEDAGEGYFFLHALALKGAGLCMMAVTGDVSPRIQMDLSRAPPAYLEVCDPKQDAQKFKFEGTATAGYTLSPKQVPAMCLQPDRKLPNNAAQIKLFDCDRSSEQRFVLGATELPDA